ncbi:MAG: DNA polymerase IV [Acidimicrobiales bacterium]
MRDPADTKERQDLDVLHVDMDCFFAAVEVLDDPRLVGRPVIVGGTGARGVVASCSYEARTVGVASAMPMSEARRRCPSAVVLDGRHDRYGEVSRRLHEVFHEFTPVVEPIALDEAFLDVAAGHRLFGDSPAIAHGVRERVQEVLGLQCSVGVARSKLLAKLASRDAKPRPSAHGPEPGPGVVVVARSDELAFLWPRPVGDLWGVGPRMVERLGSYGIHTVGDLASLDRSSLERFAGRASGRQLFDLARGDDRRPVVGGRALKSVGHEETFPVDVRDGERLQSELVRLSDSVGSRLRAAGMVGRTVNLKLRFGDFRTITRSHSTAGTLAGSRAVSRIASALLATLDVSDGVRLLGVSVSSLEAADARSGRQLRLMAVEGAGGEGGAFEGGHDGDQGDALGEAWDEVDRAVDAIRRRYGAGAVGPAAVVTATGLAVKELGDSQWGPSANRPGDAPARFPRG